MKLQLDEQTLNAYINEAIKQELNEAYKVDFDKLDKLVGAPKNKQNTNTWPWNRRYFNLEKQKQDLANGTFGKYQIGRGSNDAIQVLKDLGYDDGQIQAGIQNGLISTGKKYGTDDFTHYDRLGKQNRKDARLRTAAGMPISGPQVQKQTSQPAQEETPETTTEYPWDAITQDEINAAKQAQQKARQTAAKPKAPAQQTQPAAQPAANVEQPQPQQRTPATAVNPNTKMAVNTPGVTGPAATLAQKQNIGSNLATNAINAMGQAVRSGNNQLASKIATNATNSLAGNGRGNVASQGDIAKINNARSTMMNENAAAGTQAPPFQGNKFKTEQFQTWFNKNMGGKLVIDGIYGPKTAAAWAQYLSSEQAKNNSAETSKEQERGHGVRKDPAMYWYPGNGAQETPKYTYAEGKVKRGKKLNEEKFKRLVKQTILEMLK